jgi:hypothetical protein
MAIPNIITNIPLNINPNRVFFHSDINNIIEIKKLTNPNADKAPILLF